MRDWSSTRTSVGGDTKDNETGGRRRLNLVASKGHRGRVTTFSICAYPST